MYTAAFLRAIGWGWVVLLILKDDEPVHEVLVMEGSEGRFLELLNRAADKDAAWLLNRHRS
jgi:hypothetical protein